MALATPIDQSSVAFWKLHRQKISFVLTSCSSRMIYFKNSMCIIPSSLGSPTMQCPLKRIKRRNGGVYEAPHLRIDFLQFRLLGHIGSLQECGINLSKQNLLPTVSRLHRVTTKSRFKDLCQPNSSKKHFFLAPLNK